MFSLWFAVVGAFARGDGKLLETEIARIYVPLAAPLGCWKASARRCSLTLGYLHLDACTC